MAFKRLLIFLIVAVTLSSSTVPVLAHPTSRILGGEDATTGSFPYATSIRINGAHVCGGTIIGDQHILTAAHCFMEKGADVAVSSISVRVGSTNQFAGGKIVLVSAVEKHPSYNGLKNNLAILVLATKLEFTAKISSLPVATATTDEPKVGDKVSVAGWGEQGNGSADSAFKLQSGQFSVATEESCHDAFEEKDENNVCLDHAPKEGSCFGDGGNGAVYNGNLVSVTSFVVGACGSQYADVFTRVVGYSDWIIDVLSK